MSDNARNRFLMLEPTRKDGFCNIRFYRKFTNWSFKHIYIQSPVRIIPEHWDWYNKVIISDNPDSEKLNKELDIFHDFIMEAIKEGFCQNDIRSLMEIEETRIFTGRTFTKAPQQTGARLGVDPRTNIESPQEDEILPPSIFSQNLPMSTEFKKEPAKVIPAISYTLKDYQVLREAMRRVANGEIMRIVCESTGIPKSTLYNKMEQARKDARSVYMSIQEYIDKAPIWNGSVNIQPESQPAQEPEAPAPILEDSSIISPATEAPVVQTTIEIMTDNLPQEEPMTLEKARATVLAFLESLNIRNMEEESLDTLVDMAVAMADDNQEEYVKSIAPIVAIAKDIEGHSRTFVVQESDINNDSSIQGERNDLLYGADVGGPDLDEIIKQVEAPRQVTHRVGDVDCYNESEAQAEAFKQMRSTGQKVTVFKLQFVADYVIAPAG